MTTVNSFSGRSIIVSGAGSGIGRAAAIQFAMQGGKVLIADLNEATANVVADEIRVVGAAYTVSKHGIVGLTKSDAVMYRNRGIRVSAVAPGGTRTNIQVVPVEGTEGPKILGGYMSNVGRIAEADEVAAAILFLASDAASDVNGVILPVDGGWSAV